MATFYGVNATKMTQDVPSAKAGNGEQNGRVHVIYDTYELVADLATTDIIEMGGEIPKDARIIEATIAFDNLDTSGGTLDFGWKASIVSGEAVDNNGFIDAADCTSADVIHMSDNLAFGNGQFKKFTEAVQPIVTTDGDTDATSGTISIMIMYVIA